MKVIKFCFVILFIFVSGCRTKYDTSKAIEILPSSAENNIDLTLKDRPILIEDDQALIHSAGSPQEVASVGNDIVESVYHGGVLYFVGKRYTGFFNLESKSIQDIKHDIQNPNIAVADGFILVYNEQKFSIFDSATLENLWNEQIVADGLASRFVCIESVAACFALAINGDMLRLDIAQRVAFTSRVTQNQEMILNTLYSPAVMENYIILASGNSEFAVFDWQKNALLTTVPFVSSESSSIFDVNLVKDIYVNHNNVFISHVNGMYAFNLLYGKPLWDKKIITLGEVGLFGEYIVLYNKYAQSIFMMHAETGDLKWQAKGKINPLGIYIDYDKNIAIITSDEMHLFSSETGEKISSKKMNIGTHNSHNLFVHGNVLHWVNGEKIYMLK